MHSRNGTRRKTYFFSFSQSKTAKCFATHFSISLHFSRNNCVSGQSYYPQERPSFSWRAKMTFKVTWPRANHHGMAFCAASRQFSFSGFVFFLFIFRLSERRRKFPHALLAAKPLQRNGFSPLPQQKALQLSAFLLRQQRPPVANSDWTQLYPLI